MAVDRIPREWQALEYLNPREVLLKFAEAERQFPDRDMPDNVRSLRVRSLRPANYLRQAALFCYGMSHTSRLDVRFALFEDRDTDCVARWREGDAVHYCPIQLKELVPERVNASAEIESELGKLAKYTDALEIVVAMYINRRVHLDFPIKAPASLGVSELWLFGATSSDLKTWMLYGNILGNASKYVYEYPS